MREIHYMQGDATIPVGEGVKIIAHVCNDIGAWGKGFVLAVSNRWRKPEEEYRRWHTAGKANGFRLGAVQFVQVEDSLLIANMIGQSGIHKAGPVPPIRYEAMEECLRSVAEKAVGLSASVHMPRIGCGLAGGTWDRIGPLVEETLCKKGVEVFVYDLLVGKRIDIPPV